MATIVTGAAGFIGFHCAGALLERGEAVIGVDNLSPYYAVALKEARLDALRRHPRFRFARLDLADVGALEAAVSGEDVRRVLHLAAQPGVRYSLENPHAYVAANVAGHLDVLEFCRRRGGIEHLVYASSSSVYGGNNRPPFREDDRVDRPVSLYAATKCADELMAHTYAHLFGIPATGLRFFTVYGPWGRPDMAVWTFTEAILDDRPIRLFNHGALSRDFTYIDDIVAGVLAVLDGPPTRAGAEAPSRVYNIGNNRPERVGDLVAVIEAATGRRARIEMLPMQPGDVVETAADISLIARDFGFRPQTPIAVGVPRFVEWFRSHQHLARS